MNPRTSTRRREVIVLAILTVLFIGGILFFFTLVGGWFFPAMLLVVGALALLGLAHFTFWGRAEGRRVDAERRHVAVSAPHRENREKVTANAGVRDDDDRDDYHGAIFYSG